jgi:hypothetical protein
VGVCVFFRSKQILTRKKSLNASRTFALMSGKDLEGEQETIALALRTLGSFNLQVSVLFDKITQ